MTDPKPWWQSRAIWGSLATILASIGALVGLEIDHEALTSFLFAGATLVSGAIGLWGTIRRSEPIDPTLVAANLRVGPTGLYRVKPDE